MGKFNRLAYTKRLFCIGAAGQWMFQPKILIDQPQLLLLIALGALPRGLNTPLNSSRGQDYRNSRHFHACSELNDDGGQDHRVAQATRRQGGSR